MLPKIEIARPQIVQELQKRFQLWSRNFLYARVGDLILRQHKASDFPDLYFPESFKEPLLPESLEKLVADKANQSEFEKIGLRLKEGSEKYHQLVLHKGMDNYRFASEYNSIRDALLR